MSLLRFLCNGGCPKNRILHTPGGEPGLNPDGEPELSPEGEPGLNYLCAGYKAFFTHIDRPMRIMAAELRAGRPAANIMLHLAKEEAEVQRRFAQARRNDPCPCGSGRKFKWCHGRPPHNRQNQSV